MRYAIFFFTILFAACRPSREDAISSIRQSITQVNQSFAGNEVDTTALRMAVTGIQQFENDFPADTLLPGFLFELGMLYQKQRNFTESVEVLQKVYSAYPESKQAANALFLQGFLYANELRKLDSARMKYELFLEKYSQTDEKLTADVEMELKYLGKTPDEILKEWEEQGMIQTDSISAGS